MTSLLRARELGIVLALAVLVVVTAAANPRRDRASTSVTSSSTGITR